LQLLEPLLGVSKAFRFQVGNAKKVGSLEVIVEGHRSLQLVNGGFVVAPIEINASQNILSASLPRILSERRPNEFASLLDIPGAKPGQRRVGSDLSVTGREFQSFVQLTCSFVETGFGNRKIGELPQAERNGFVVVALRIGEISGS